MVAGLHHYFHVFIGEPIVTPKPIIHEKESDPKLGDEFHKNISSD